MAILTNLTGTMKSLFVLGKNGVRLTSTSTELEVQNYDGTDLRPIVIANPSKDTHAVNLAYFKANTSGSASNPILHGTTVPSASFGQDGYSYYQMEDGKIENIFIKIAGTWIPLNAVEEDTEEYIVQSHVVAADWVDNGDSTSTVQISAETHGKGPEIVVQVQMLDGSLVIPAVQIDDIGNITLTQTTGPTNCNVVIIGETDMTAPYTGSIAKDEWVTVDDHFELSIPQSTHQQASGALFVSCYENVVDGPTSTSPWNLVGIQMQIDSESNIILKSSKAFSGKVVITGK